MPNSSLQKPTVEAEHAQLYDILISQLTDFAVFLTDQQGFMVSWNPGVERILGYSEAEWIGQPVEIIFTPEDQAQGKPKQEIETALEKGQSPDIRWHVRRDGTRLFVEGTLVALRDTKGSLLGFSKVMRDITDRKIREQELRDALAYAESILNTVSEPLLVLDRDLRVQFANSAFSQQFAASKEGIQNRLLGELCNGQWGDPQVRTLIEEHFPDQTAISSVEIERDFPNLGRRAMVLKARRLWRDGSDTGLTLLAIDDVTKRREAEKALAESEKQLRLVMDATPAIISYIDRDLRYRMASGAYERWFGVAPSDLVGRSIFELFEVPLLEIVQPYIERVLKGETVSFEESYPERSGSSRMLQITYTPDLDDQGQAQGFMVLGSDVSERQETNRALREGEERWRSLFEGMSEGFFTGEVIYEEGTGKACDFRFVETNPAFERLTGLIGVAGQKVRDVIPGVQEELIQTYAAVAKSSEPVHFEARVPVLNDRWYEVRARATGAGRFAALFLDISERKKAELQLMEAEQRQAALVTLGDRLRDSKDIPSLTSAAMEIAGTVLSVHRAGYGEVDETQEFVTIENGWRSGGISTLAGTYRFSDFGKDLGERLRRGETIAISDVTVDPITAAESDRWKALEIQALINVPLIEQGRLAAVLFIQSSAPRLWTDSELTFVHKVADRTWAAAERARALKELQESEEFNRSVLASTPDCVKIVDLEGRLLTMNEGGCRQMEIDDFSLCMNQPWADFWTSAQDFAGEALAKARSGQTARFEGFCPTAKGTPKWWEVIVSPMLDSSGKPVRILSLSRDITERKGAEKERDRLTGELKRSNEELSQFAHIVAHDLQSPLRGVISFAQLLVRKTRGTLGTGEQEMLNQIVENGHRMQELVLAVLRLAQVGQGDIDTKPVRMEEVADAALRSLQTQIQEHEARITRHPLPVVAGNPVQLVQLLQNLIGNALKYRRVDEGLAITIRATKEGDGHVFAIEDNGEGIAPEYLDRIFEPLKRLHGVEVPGTGLGLTICQRIVKRHRGRMWVESKPGVGSTFYFTLAERPGVEAGA